MNTTITLDEMQVEQLIAGKSIKVGDNRYVELLKDEILININGFGYYPSKIHIEYKEYSDQCELIAEKLQEKICEHLNLEPYNVIFYKSSGSEFEFYIKFDNGNISQIVVCDFQTAINNTNEFRDFNKIKQLRKELPPYIGLYKRLNNSCYYFRWFEEI